MVAGVLEVSAKRELVERVANSPAFRRSQRLREFLLYVAECTLSDRLQDARELQIAQKIFSRRTDYNPAQDNIVRVEARSLRKRLEVYFAGDGKDEPVIIVMPKGGYIIAFEPRPLDLGITEEQPVVSIVESSVAPSPPVLPRWPTRTQLMIMGAMVLLLAIVFFWARADRFERLASRDWPFSALIDDQHDTYIVTSDTSLVLIQELLERQISLDDYLSRRFETSATLHPARADLTRMLRNRNYTNTAEMTVAAQIIQSKGDPGKRIFLRSSRDMHFSEVKNQNVILLGSTIGNPWAKLFGDKLNFEFDMDANQRGFYRNRSPRNGEQSVYSMTTRSGETGDAYAVVAFLPNVNRNGHVLLIGGTTSEGTQAGGEFIMDASRTAKALQAMGITPSGSRHYFELLLRTKAVAGSATESAIVAHRIIPARLESPIAR